MYVLLFCLQLCYFLPFYASHDPRHGSDFFSLLFLFHAAGFWKVLLPIIPISSFFSSTHQADRWRRGLGSGIELLVKDEPPEVLKATWDSPEFFRNTTHVWTKA